VVLGGVGSVWASIPFRVDFLQPPFIDATHSPRLVGDVETTTWFKGELSRPFLSSFDSGFCGSRIEHLSEILKNVDPKIKKRAVQALLGEIIIHPKNGETRGRLLEIKGVYFPLVRVNVVVPTGLEPVLPT
jgi:hypothetical protein